MDLFVQFLIIIHLFFGSHAISVRDYASNKLQQEYTKRDVRGQADNSELLEGNKFSMSTFDVQFDCENKIKGQIIETEFNLLILSGSELFAINTNANGSTLDKLAILGGVNTSPLNAKATFWTNEKIILVLAFSTHYSIYKIPFGIHQSSVMPPIQKIRIIQEIPVKIALYRRGEELFCLLASKISKFRGILRLYNWHLMHFKEEINQYVSGMDDVLHTKWNNNEEAAIATVFVTKEKKLEIRLLNRYTLMPLQTLNAHGKFVRFIELHEKTFLAICSVNFCDIYQWVGVRFNHWRRVNLLGGFHEFRIGHNVIIYRFNHTMFVSNRADLTPIGSINCTTARIYFHKMYESDTIWAVSVFVEPPQMRLNFIEIPHMAATEPSAARHHVHESPFVKFHECTKKLKQEFNTIYGGITRIASLNPGILRRDRIADFPGKIIVKNYTKINENTTVGVARIPLDVAATPTELLKNVAHLNLRKLQLQTEIENAFKMAAAANTTSSHPRRLRRRDIGENGTSVQREKWPSIRGERVKVGNLRTNSEKWLKLLLKNSSKVQRIALGNVKSLQVANLNVSHTINGINIDEDLYNLPENLVQNKFINIMNCKHLIVKNSINSIHINDFFGLFAKGRAHHASTFHVDQVIVENIQEMNFDTLYQSLYLHNSSREIDGNLIFYNVTTVTHMEAGGINGRATDDLVPLHTNQIINSTIRINQFRVEHFEADTVNDIEFRQETLALIGKDNHFQEYTKRDVRGQADNSELLEGNKFSMSTFDVQFDCENKIKGQIIETEFNLLILSGSELFAINTNANGSTLDKLAILGGVNTSPINAKVIKLFATLYNWHLMHFKEEINQYVSGMDDVLHTKWNNNEEAAIATVFVTKEKKLEIRLLNRYTLMPLQTLNAHGKFVRFIELHEKTFLAICSVNFCDIYQWVGVRFNHWRRVNLLGGFHEFRIGHNVIIYRFNHTMFVSNRARFDANWVN
uniref:Putative secreted protein n=1 Tax=Lutzomyia longipalpis TaxID=7200 RepID=A0A1B0CM72_LUTLO